MIRLTIFIAAVSAITSLQAKDKQPTNKHFWYTMKTKQSSAAVWSIWMDVPNWKNWDTGLKDASSQSRLQLGSKGTILSLEDRESKFEVVAFEEGKSYTYRTSLPLGSLYVKRYLETDVEGTTFTHEVWFKGLTSGIFAKAFGAKFRNMLPDVLLNIKKIAEGDVSH